MKKFLKYHSSLKMGLVSVVAATLSIASATATIANPTQTPQPSSIANLVAQSQSVDFSGTFVAAEAPTTTGTALLC